MLIHSQPSLFKASPIDKTVALTNNANHSFHSIIAALFISVCIKDFQLEKEMKVVVYNCCKQGSTKSKNVFVFLQKVKEAFVQQISVLLLQG